MKEETYQNMTHSMKFPPGYGDFALKSSDGITFHFPKVLLVDNSDFFNGMFSLPEDESRPKEELLVLAEPAAIVELLLLYIDPKVDDPPLNPNTIMEVLEVGRKYMVPTVLSSFDNRARIRPMGPYGSFNAEAKSFVMTHPVLALHCATEYELPDTGRAALKEVIILPSNRLSKLLRDSSLPPTIRVHVMELRKQRIGRYEALLEKLVKANREEGCCVTDLDMWIANIDQEVRYSPTWDSFTKVYKARQCGCSLSFGYDGKLNSDIIESGRVTILEEERQLPAWPMQ